MIKFKFPEYVEDRHNWVSFYPKRNKGNGFNLTFENHGYFDPRPQINTNVTTIVALILPFISLWLIPISLVLCFYAWGSLYIRLPWDTGHGDTAENKTYGLMFYHFDEGFPSEFWMRSCPSLSFYFPWHYTFQKREILLKDGWYTEQKGDNLWDNTKWGDKILYETHPYTYVLKSGKIQNVNAKIHEEKRTWKRWFGLSHMMHHDIEVEFDKEVGERSGSWKGGTIGCGYRILPGETRLDTLRRMEKERKF